MREIVPAGTAPLHLIGEHAGRELTAATVLPLAAAALVRQDGNVVVALQTAVGSDDPSRDLAAALETALAADPGSVIPATAASTTGPRLQDLLDLNAPFEVTVHEDFDFWVDDSDHVSADVAASLERANALAAPTSRLTSVDAAYWCKIGSREQVRWVLPYDEENLLDALARLHAEGADSLGEDSRLLGTFRAYGLLVPVWDLAGGTSPADVEDPSQAFSGRLTEALGRSTQLTDDERRARSGLANRQMTLR